MGSGPEKLEKKTNRRSGRGGGGVEDILFFTPPPSLEFLGFLLYPWKVEIKQGFAPRNSTKLCYTPRKLYGLKPRPPEIPHDFFLMTPGNSMLFLINSWKTYLLFLLYPWKFHILNPPATSKIILQAIKQPIQFSYFFL